MDREIQEMTFDPKFLSDPIMNVTPSQITVMAILNLKTSVLTETFFSETIIYKDIQLF